MMDSKEKISTSISKGRSYRGSMSTQKEKKIVPNHQVESRDCRRTGESQKKDLVVDNDGFLIPQSGAYMKTNNDDNWLNRMSPILFNDEAWDNPFSEVGSLTLPTEAMTRSFSNSKRDLFLSPCPPKSNSETRHFRSPEIFEANFNLQCNENFANFDLLSPIPEPKPAFASGNPETPTFIIEPGEMVLNFERIRPNTPISLGTSAAVRGRNLSNPRPFHVFGEKKPRIRLKPKNASGFFHEKPTNTYPDKGKRSHISPKTKMRRLQSTALLTDTTNRFSSKEMSPRTPTTPEKSQNTLKARLRRQRSESAAKPLSSAARPAPSRRGVQRGLSEASGTLNRPRVHTRGRRYSAQENRRSSLSQNVPRTPRDQKTRKSPSSGPSSLSKLLRKSTASRRNYPILEIDQNAMDEVSVLTPAAPAQLEGTFSEPHTPSNRSQGSKTSIGTGPTVASSSRSSTENSLSDIASLEKEILALVASPDVSDSLKKRLLAVKIEGGDQADIAVQPPTLDLEPSEEGTNG